MISKRRLAALLAGQNIVKKHPRASCLYDEYHFFFTVETFSKVGAGCHSYEFSKS